MDKRNDYLDSALLKATSAAAIATSLDKTWLDKNIRALTPTEADYFVALILVLVDAVKATQKELTKALQ